MNLFAAFTTARVDELAGRFFVPIGQKIGCQPDEADMHRRGTAWRSAQLLTITRAVRMLQPH
jgi:hypothetical protein